MSLGTANPSDRHDVDDFRSGLRDFVPNESEGVPVKNGFSLQDDETLFGIAVDSDDKIDFGTIDFDAFDAAPEPFDELLDELDSDVSSAAQAQGGIAAGAAASSRGRHAAHAKKASGRAGGGGMQAFDVDYSPYGHVPRIEPETKRSSLRTVLIALASVVVVAALALGGYYLYTHKADPAAPQTTVQPTAQQPVASEPTVQGSLRVTVRAEGYDANASPIMYRLEYKSDANANQSSSASSSSRSSSSSSSSSAGVQNPRVRYGIVNPVSEGKRDSQTVQLEPGTFEVNIEDLPAGRYELSWSASILADGSYLGFPPASTFQVDDDSIELNVAFTLFDSEDLPAVEAKAAFDSVILWLNMVAGDTAAQRGDIVSRIEQIAAQARENVENVPSVEEEGGVDYVSYGSDEEDEEASEEGDFEVDTYDYNGGYNYSNTYAYTYDNTYVDNNAYVDDNPYIDDSPTPDDGGSQSSEPYYPEPDPVVPGDTGGDNGGSEGGSGA